MTDEQLTEELARQVMGWKVAPDRFLMERRQWLPRWRFRPLHNVGDALRLLEAAAPLEYTMGAGGDGGFWVKVQIARRIGTASDKSKPRAITLAVARALGVNVG